MSRQLTIESRAKTASRNADYLTSRSRYWMVTCNAPDDDLEGVSLRERTIPNIETLFENKSIEYTVGSWERGTDNDRLHIQAYVVLRNVQRGSWLGSRIHCAYVIPSKHGLMTDGIAYCDNPEKDGYIGKAFEYGTVPSAGQGRRTDLETVNEAIQNESAVTLRDVNDLRVSVAANHPNWVAWRLAEQNRDAYLREERYRDPYIPRVWQHWLYRYLTECKPDERKVIFVTDRVGHAGKSRFCDEFERSSGKRCQVLRPAPKRDMVAALENRREVLFIDVPRGRHQFLDTVYVFMEEAKDGKLVSEKYNSHTRYQPLMHIVVFLNEEVNTGTDAGTLTVPNPQGGADRLVYRAAVPAPLSHDRYAIWDLSDTMTMEYSPDHPKWGDRFPPFKGFDEEFRQTAYTPPLVVTSGPEFRGDMAGDGPRDYTFERYMSRNGYYRVIAIADLRTGYNHPSTFTVSPRKRWEERYSPLDEMDEWESSKWFNAPELEGFGMNPGGLLYDLDGVIELQVVDFNGNPIIPLVVAARYTFHYWMHVDHIPDVVLSELSLTEDSVLVVTTEVHVSNYAELLIPTGAACA